MTGATDVRARDDDDDDAGDDDRMMMMPDWRVSRVMTR